MRGRVQDLPQWLAQLLISKETKEKSHIVKPVKRREKALILLRNSCQVGGLGRGTNNTLEI